MNLLHVIVVILLFGLCGLALSWAFSKWPIPQTIRYIIMAAIGIFFLIVVINMLGLGELFYVPVSGEIDAD